MTSLSDEITTLKTSQSIVVTTLDSLNKLETESKNSTEATRYIGSPQDDILFEQIFALSGS